MFTLTVTMTAYLSEWNSFQCMTTQFFKITYLCACMHFEKSFKHRWCSTIDAEYARGAGYAAGECVRFYTALLNEIDGGVLGKWHDRPAPTTARDWWHLRCGASMRDLVMAGKPVLRLRKIIVNA